MDVGCIWMNNVDYNTEAMRETRDGNMATLH